MGDERLAKEFEEDAQDPGNWEVDEAGVSTDRKNLQTQVTVRLSVELAEELRAVAEERGVGYTTLIREWLEDRLSQRERRTGPLRPDVQQAGYAQVGSISTDNPWQASGDRIPFKDGPLVA